jgi:hypothetical protein
MGAPQFTQFILYPLAIETWRDYFSSWLSFFPFLTFPCGTHCDSERDTDRDPNGNIISRCSNCDAYADP